MEIKEIREYAKRAMNVLEEIEFLTVIAQLKRLLTENNIDLTRENLNVAFSVAQIYKIYSTENIEITNKEHVIDVLKRYTQIKDIAYEI